jgi:membrane-associated phospholipid phosphatase
MRNRTLLTLVAFTAAVHTAGAAIAGAQSVGRMVVDDVSNSARDLGAIWVAPFRGSAKDYLITAGVLGIAGAVSPLDDEVDNWAVKNRDRGFLDAIRPFRRGGDLYSLNHAMPYVAGLYVVGLATGHRGIRDGIFGCAAAYGANTTIRHQVIYRVLGRNRPDTVRSRPEGYVPVPAEQGDQYAFRVPSKGYGDHSFPGGHIATMATCGAFLSDRFEMGVVEPVLAGMVLVMGIGRLADQGHWMSDQIVGGVYGYAIGKEIARRQKSRLARERREKAEGNAREATGAIREPAGSVYVGKDLNGTRLGWQHSF